MGSNYRDKVILGYVVSCFMFLGTPVFAFPSPIETGNPVVTPEATIAPEEATALPTPAETEESDVDATPEETPTPEEEASPLPTAAEAEEPRAGATPEERLTPEGSDLEISASVETEEPSATATPTATAIPVNCCFCLSWASRPPNFGQHCRNFRFPADCTHSQSYLNTPTTAPALPADLLSRINGWRCQNVRIAYYHHGNPPMCRNYFSQVRACITEIRKNNSTGQVFMASAACNIFGDRDLLRNQMTSMRDACPPGFQCRVAAHVTLGLLQIGGNQNLDFGNLDGCNVPYITALVSSPTPGGDPISAGGIIAGLGEGGLGGLGQIGGSIGAAGSNMQMSVPACSLWVGQYCSVDRLTVPCREVATAANPNPPPPRRMRCLGRRWQDDGLWGGVLF